MTRKLPLRSRSLLVVVGMLFAAPALAQSAPRTQRAPQARHSVIAIRSGVVGQRYCELLFVYKAHTGFVADVYNTFGLNKCPAATWKPIDTTALAKANHALLAVRNGPRYWLMNQIEKRQQGKQVIKSFGGLRMILEATLPLAGLSTQPFTIHHVNRATTFIYNAGQTVYELRAPNRAVWVMQSFSQQTDPALNRGELAKLRSKLRLPPGWSYSSHRLTRPLRIVTVNTAAQVLQDNLQNTYSRQS